MDFEAYQVHTKTHLTSFMCNNEKCGEVFPSQSKLVVHKNHKHGMGDKDEPCPYCAKCVFNLKTHIKDTMRVNLYCVQNVNIAQEEKV